MQQEEYLHTKLREIREQNKIIDALAAKVKDSEILIGTLTAKVYEMDDKIKLQEVTSEVTLNLYEMMRLALECLTETLAKDYCRDLKHALSLVTQKPTAHGLGFAKPKRISDELAKFLGKTVGTEMTRDEVSKEINPYIRERGLQDKENGRKIHPDASLSNLLAVPPSTDKLTYFTIQHYVSRHFI